MLTALTLCAAITIPEALDRLGQALKPIDSRHDTVTVQQPHKVYKAGEIYQPPARCTRYGDRVTCQ